MEKSQNTFYPDKQELKNGLVELSHNGSKFAGEDPDAVEIFIKRLQDFELCKERCSIGCDRYDNIQYFGNFYKISAGFMFTVKRGSKYEKAITPYFIKLFTD